MKKKLSFLFVIIVITYLIFLIRPVFLDDPTGTFERNYIPAEYLKLQEFISSQSDYSRTLWVPGIQRYSFYSHLHPQLSAKDFFKTTSNREIIEAILENRKDMQEASIKYIIVPFDSEGEMFLDDRKYSEKEYQKVVDQVSKIPWLKEIKGFGKIKVFEVPYPKDHFFINENQQVKYETFSSVEYSVSLKNVKKGDSLIFSENYDLNWIATIDDSNTRIKSSKFNDRLNSFTLPKEGNYDLRIYYKPQDWVNLGLIVSGLSLALILLALFYSKLKKW